MRTSESTAEIFAALVNANLLITNPKKTSKVNAGAKRYAFAPLPELLDDLRPILQIHGLVFIQEAVDDGAGRVGSASMLVHRSGEWLSFDPLMLPAGNNAQDAGSAVTYSRRYTLCAALGIAADEDDDGEKASAPRKSSPGGQVLAGQGAEKVKETPGPSGEADPASPFAGGTEEYGLWNALVAAAGSETRALARLNAVVRPPVEKKALGFVAAKDLMRALEAMEEIKT